MDTTLHDYHKALVNRQSSLADHWFHAIVSTGFSPHSHAAVRHQLIVLVEQAIALHLAPSFDERSAQEIGITVAALRYLGPEALQGTLTALGTSLGTDLPAPLLPRLVALLSAIAAGHVEHLQSTMLAEQETIRDALIAERDSVSDALRAVETRFRVIFEGAAIGITLATLEGRPVACNPAVERILGYSCDELRAVAFTEITYPEDLAVDLALFTELVTGAREFYRKEKRYLHKDGHVVWCNLTVSLARDVSGHPEYTIGMIDDITEQKQLTDMLTETQRRLVESREMERLRLARDLHDTAVQHLLDINLHLANTRQSAGTEAFVTLPVTTIETMQHKVQEITAQMRNLVRGLRPPGLEEFGLAAALEGLVEHMRIAGLHGIVEVALDLVETGIDIPLSVTLPVFRAAQEALRNASVHAHAEHIALLLRVHPEAVVLVVRDDGRGFNIPTTRNLLADENHFGLIGIIERVTLANGELVIDSAPGRGTEIRVHVPIPMKGGRDDRYNLRRNRR